ncbi:Crp/Fnr family transcriptional regulator [Acidovorax sp. FJL06]|uniref:Crp/Fnr family transcriptional regulator n=1 Tax=Acidovorax sp. FJL06 TaxID=2153365 RepID=UPI000F56689D|nr:Crp/Fnr family transcriptional regulator [Acidovorax sp. FJL06]RQO79195.1 Crp/Fnr family transcriptional regulator [Acidovorax sp. FJL06]
MTPAASACTVCQPPALEALVQSEPALAALWQALPRRQFSAGTLLQRAGETSTHCWQVRSGVVRLFYLNEQGTERNRSFHGAGQWVAGSLPPLALPSPYAIEALAPVEAVELPYATLPQLQRSFPPIGPPLEQALGHVFQQHAQREAELLSHPPEVRYQSFLATHSDLVPLLPQHHVASYLGISPVSLSRIRARLGMVDTARSGG